MIGKNKHLISLKSYTPRDINKILNRAQQFKKKTDKKQDRLMLTGKRVALIFTKASTRTRVSFESAIHDLGGLAIYLSPESIQMGRGESLEDTIKVLERYLDGIIIRNDSQKDLENICEFSNIPIINGLSDLAHPCQALADLLTIKEKKKEKLDQLKVTYLGEGNNVAASLAQICHLMEINLQVISPPGFSCSVDTIQRLKKRINFYEERSLKKIHQLVQKSDVIYTDTWFSMGGKKEKKKRKLFSSFQVNREMMEQANRDCIFLHCLPAYRGEETTEEIIDGPHSVVFDQAENRLHIQKAILCLLLK